ncbi:MAG: twin-arginine translocase subunit TatC [Bdellovibrionales bacterium]|nr:twin-arginine translocase subunit TatC [Bdellovibrionales bacterium]
MNVENEGDKSITLVDHLAELRTRIWWSMVAVFVGFIACFNFSEFLFDIVRQPIAPYLKATGGLVFTAPTDKFIAHLKVSFLAGTIVTCPVWMYHVWKFVSPGLYDKEKKYAVAFIGFGSLLFMMGTAFVYFAVFPMAFKFLMTFGGSTDTPMITIGEYLSFFVTTTLVFGVAFEMPVILAILGMTGLISAEFLSTYRRYAYVLLATASAVFTPPDALSMILMLAPMLVLYELSVLLVRFLAPKPVTFESTTKG